MEDSHFLRRLEQISRPQVDLALSLSRDPELVRSLNAWANLPPDRGRVAVTLEHDPAGPPIVITQPRAFVTCLGAGMSTGALPVISRLKMDNAAS